uniref:NADH-ubiquinone oxidoreductase chain 1 n=1 Tax=Ophiopholis mirabilis TaxID=2705304 RepID=A0A6C0FEU7_9ECHI|nr:NADH dehydrogenase subunit 1 [Ophiopholis mirabilis]QHT54272.1 NADH dehydrogenase subunit 1 [Ophiopholis mirabilis]
MLFEFLQNELFQSILLLLSFLGLIIPVLLAVALLTLLERKVIGYMQLRKGPNLVGPLGVLQPIADGLKLFIKESFKPSSASPLMFFGAPASFFFIAVVLWGVIPLQASGLNVTFSLFFIIAVSSLSAYSILVAGWSSNSKYALVGALRGVAQIISYEVSFSLIVVPLAFFVGSWGLFLFQDLQSFVWLIFPCFPLFLMWYISTLAETNRAPFDLTEGESELVSGYNVEFSGAPFALFFIGEYANIILVNLLTVLLFLGGCSPFMSLVGGVLFISFKCLFLVFSFLWVRSSFPRIRYDQLMMVMWKGFLPWSVSLLVLFFVVLFLFNGFPPFF